MNTIEFLRSRDPYFSLWYFLPVDDSDPTWGEYDIYRGHRLLTRVYDRVEALNIIDTMNDLEYRMGTK